MYNSQKYWNERPEPNGHNNITSLDTEYIPKFIEGSKKILDFGCGIGRTFELYRGYDVTGLDFSTIYQQRAIDSANKYGLTFNHIVHNVHEKDLPFNDNHFDKGLMISVLLHANQNELIRILNEMSRVCKEVFIISLYNPRTLSEKELTTQKNQASHVFNHNYKLIIEKLNFDLLSYKEIDGQVVISYSKK